MRRVLTGCLIAAVLLAGGMIAQQKRPQDVDLQAAIRKETVDGDLNGAIKAYRTVTTKYAKDRAVTAQALVHMAECYRKLGDVQADKLYAQVLLDYSDQKDAVAQVHLGSASGGRIRRESVDLEHVDVMAVSPDGRFAGVLGSDGKDLLVRDLTTHQNRLVTRVQAGEVDDPVFSPNGKRLAFVVAVYASDKNSKDSYEIRIINLDGSGARTVCQGGEDWVDALGWTPDGGKLLCGLHQEQRKYSLAWHDLTTGVTQPVATVTRSGNVSTTAVVSPDGRYIAIGAVAGKAEKEIHVMASDGTGETVLSANPADIYIIGWSPDGTQVLVTSQRSYTTGLWAFPVTKGKPNGEPVVLERDLNPGGGAQVLPIGLTQSGAFFYRANRFTSDVYIAAVDPRTGLVISSPTPVPTSRSGFNVAPKWSPDSHRLLFYWAPQTPSNSTLRELSVLSLDTGVEQPVRALDFHGGNVCYLNDSAWLTSYGVDHSKFVRINPATGEATPLFESKNDLARLSCSSDGKLLAYIEGSGPSKNIKFRNLETGAEKVISSVARNYFWLELSRDGSQIAFTAPNMQDRTQVSLFVAPVVGGAERELTRLKTNGQVQFTYGLSWSADSRYLYYMHSGGLQDSELFRISATGGPEESAHLKVPNLRDINVSPDGAHIAFSLGATNKAEIWALENFLYPAK